MFELKGRYTDALLFLETCEEGLVEQIYPIINSQIANGLKIRIMPDAHVGKGICVGFTMELGRYISPAFCGVDIGCGMLAASFTSTEPLDLPLIDELVKKRVPMGFSVHEGAKSKKIPYEEVQIAANSFVAKYNEKFGTSYVAPSYNEKWLKTRLKSIGMDSEKFFKSIGTLGGGNHYYEVGIEDVNKYWVTIHCGSRNFGVKVCEYWMKQAKTQSNDTSAEYLSEFNSIVNDTIDRKTIPQLMKELREKHNKGIEQDYLSNELAMGYFLDMIFAQKYAEWNRQAILDISQKILKVKAFDEVISSVHNYVDFHDFIIRKGAISSYVGQKMIIPFNQKDGMVICEGKSNPDWNNSAPHGAGRLYSRSKAKELISLEMVEESMKGIYSTSVCDSTIDESVFAYKDSKMIEAAIQDTATILHRVKPVLNIKDSTSAPRRSKKDR
jgi:RNA-splicing ligase RtcB